MGAGHDVLPRHTARAQPVAEQATELRQQIRRLSHHPSIVIWDGCNECGGGGLYESFVMPTVASLDRSRPIWPSCPGATKLRPGLCWLPLLTPFQSRVTLPLRSEHLRAACSVRQEEKGA